MTQAAIITVSDSRAAGLREDLSGPAIARVLGMAGFDVVEVVIVPDEQGPLEAELLRHAGRVRMVVTTGGTGIAPRDITPEATRAVCERLLDGVAEQMRSAGVKETPFAALSRGVCGTLGQTLILNLPGNPKGAVTSLGAVLPLLPHALRVLAGDSSHEEADDEHALSASVAASSVAAVDGNAE